MMLSERSREWRLSWSSGPALLQAKIRRREASELYSALEPSSPISFDFQTLQDLLHIVNHELLCRELLSQKSSVVREASSETSLFTSDEFPIALHETFVIRLLNTLSSCLVRSISPTAYRERELQCRAILSTIALLLAMGVKGLQHEFYDEIRESISRRFEDLQWQQGPSGEPSHVKICKVQCAYLLSAAKEYSYRFDRAQPVLLAMSSRIISVLSFVLSVSSPALGGGGFHLGDALSHLRDSSREIARKPNTQFDTLFDLQALSMLVSALHTFHDTVQDVPEKNKVANVAQECAQNLSLTTLHTAKDILSKNPSYEEISPPAEFWQTYVRTTMRRGPPPFKLFYYVYGIVDCATYITTCMQNNSLGKLLWDRMIDVVLKGDEATHRWKAFEYLVSVSSNHHQVRRQIQSSPDISSQRRRLLKEELDYIVEAATGEVVSYPLPLKKISSNESARTPSIISATDCTESASFEAQRVNIDADCSTYSIPTSDGKSRSIASLVHPHRTSVRRSEFPTENVLSAGFSPDCKFAFAQTSERAVVISLSCLEPDNESFVQIKQQRKGFKMIQAVLSDKYLAAVSKTELRVTAYRHPTLQIGRPDGVQTLRETCASTPWSPTCLAIHDAKNRSWIAVAGETTLNGSTCGAVEIFEVCPGSKVMIQRHNYAFTQSTRDTLVGKSITWIDFSRDGSRLVCIANNNRVFVWLLSNNLRPRHAPFDIKQKFGPGAGFSGVTSASVFESQSGNNYILATTWVSTEPHVNGGEWSFISPISSTRAEVPSKFTHKLTRLGLESHIVTGAVSPKGTLLALWKKTGEIMIIPLESKKEGGLKSRDMVQLDKTLKPMWKPENPSPSSLRFRRGKNGLELYILGRRGTVLFKRFEGLETAADGDEENETENETDIEEEKRVEKETELLLAGLSVDDGAAENGYYCRAESSAR